uniref:SCAN box domain-containing protein n=1 Tax=Gasterosteus aculeatus aculeatus TaxID=481459 RepID=A0AAQ4S4F2_GASAC
MVEDAGLVQAELVHVRGRHRKFYSTLFQKDRRPLTNKMEDILKILIAGQQAQMKINVSLLEEQKKVNLLKAEELQLQKQMADRNVRPIKPSDYLSKMGATDDVEAFLHAFEATAARKAWPRDQWVGLLAPFLTGESLNALRDLGPDQATDYKALKTEVLSRNGVMKFGMAQRFHSWTFQHDQPPRAQMHELVRITWKWLEPQRNVAPAVVEAVVVDRYLRALPYEAKRFLSQQALTTADLTVEAMEKYQAATEMLRASRKEPSSAALTQTEETGPKATNPASSGAPGRVGHLSCQCGTQAEKPIPTAESSSSPPAPQFASLIGLVDVPPQIDLPGD